ncbi:hypothetical protein LTR36_009525 [Oleoguttula mirabilis]|uniref:Uncharacterized protein n=1 Tax=Oleoguttula mirabilis TaxID=1507867 RepID=A0AAV9JT71_9PEZI|nr:hypothetical protein LTR36_009525 [Oleoguttula mirabilis]
MAGRYIPPALRNKSGADEKKPPVKPERSSARFDELVSAEEVKSHFWPADGADGTLTHDKINQTLHDAAVTPGKLAYLFLFYQANPRFDTDHIIYVKSNLDLLPHQSADSSNQGEAAGVKPDGETSCSIDETAAGVPVERVSAHRVPAAASTPGDTDEPAAGPVTIFKQTRRGGSRSFAIEGWSTIERLAFCESHSPELVRILEQKWTKTDRRGNVIKEQRDERSWQESLRHRWAVLKFARDEVAEKDRGRPKAQRLADEVEESGPTKSVNETLAAMRLGNEVEVGEQAVEAA